MNLKFPRLVIQKPRTLEFALQQVIPRRGLRRVRRTTKRSRWIEDLCATYDLDSTKLLGKTAALLKLEALPELESITNDLVLRTGFTVGELQSLDVAPQPSPDESSYSLALADPTRVSIEEFESLGIRLGLTLGSKIETAWNNFLLDGTKSASEPEVSQATEPEEYSFEIDLPIEPESNQTPADPDIFFCQEDVTTALADLAVQCRAHGADQVRLFNGGRCCYEFTARGHRYSGNLHERFVSALQELIGADRERTISTRSVEIPKLLLEAIESNEGEASLDEPDYILSWCSGSPPQNMVIIIDDDRRFSFLLGEILRKRGFTVSSFFSAKEALAQIENRSITPRLIVCDVHMPEMDGGGFLAGLHRMRVQIPVLMLTSDDDPSIQAEMARLGAHAFLGKREDLQILLAWVENLIFRAAGRI